MIYGVSNQKWLWQQEGWPKFTWNIDAQALNDLASLKRCLASSLSNLDSHDIGMAQLEALQKEIIHNSLLEGVRLPEDAVRSSLFRRLAIKGESPNVFDRRAQNCMELLVESITTDKQISKKMLIDWQIKAVAGTGTPGGLIGRYRDASDGPMQVVSGHIGNERIHYEAVPGEDVEQEMEAFLEWLNSKSSEPLVVKAAIAHLYFVLIHPFGDGNGRIARTISEYVIARENPAEAVFAGMSAQLQSHRKEYDNQLDMIKSFDVSEWVNFNICMRCNAIRMALHNIDAIKQKHVLMHAIQDSGCSVRQMDIVYRAFDCKFLGKLTVRRYARMAKCGIDQAKNDLADLIEKGILVEEGKNFELSENIRTQIKNNCLC